jgi:hypothetical protein
MADIVKLNYYVVAKVDQAEVPKFRAIRDRFINVASPSVAALSPPPIEFNRRAACTRHEAGLPSAELA